MNLTDDLKKKLEAAKSKEEADAILARAKIGAKDAGIVIDDAELDQVAGGGGWRDIPEDDNKRIFV